LFDKKFIYVTDQGSNVVKACRIMGAERFGSVIEVDGIGNMVNFKS